MACLEPRSYWLVDFLLETSMEIQKRTRYMLYGLSMLRPQWYRLPRVRRGVWRFRRLSKRPLARIHNKLKEGLSRMR